MDRNTVSRSNSLLSQQPVASSSTGPAQESTTADNSNLFHTMQSASGNNLVNQHQSVASSSSTGPTQASVTEDDNSLFRTHRYDGILSRKKETVFGKISKRINEATYPIRKKINTEEAILKKTETKLNEWIEQNKHEINSPLQLHLYETAKQRILTCLKNNSHTLDLSGLDLTNLPTNIFKHLTHLQTINLSNNKLTNLDGLQNLPPQLITLNLSNNQLENVNGLSLPRVRDLNLSNNLITNLNGLNIPWIRNLNLSHNKISNLNELTLNYLIMLDVSNNLITDLNGLNLPKLITLNLSHNGLRNPSDVGRPNLPELMTLNLSHNRIANSTSNPNQNPFFNLRLFLNLRTLNLSHNRLTSLTGVQELNHLTDLDLSHNRLTNLESKGPYINLNGINPITSLITLNLSHNLLTNLNELRLRNLTTLDLSHNDQLRDVGTNNKLPNIENVFMDNNQLLTILELNILFRNNEPTLSRNNELTLLSSKITNIFKKAGYTTEDIPKLTQQWDTLQNIDGFKTFINRIDEIADISRGDIETEKMAYQELANIILKMDKNDKIREQCVAVATSSLGDCNDAINYGFLRMQLIANKLNHNNNSLHTLYENQKKLMAFDFVINLANQKIEWLIDHPKSLKTLDKLEVGLGYLKSCSDLLDINISNMHFIEYSHVEDGDKTIARELLSSHMGNENNTYNLMIDNDEIKTRYKNAFDNIDKKYASALNKINNKYLNKMRGRENNELKTVEKEYERALLPINTQIMEEKIAFLKKMMETEKH